MRDFFLISDVSFPAFPLNALMFLLWVVSVFFLWKDARNSRLCSFLLSPRATSIAIGLLLVSGIIIGLTGRREYVVSWPFIILLLFFQTVLLMVILRGWRRKGTDGRYMVRWRFILLHAGLLTAVASAFWGAPDTEVLRVRLQMDYSSFAEKTIVEAFREDGSRTWINYGMVLTDFKMETNDEGVPVMYEASLLIDGEKAGIKVNHPYSRRFGENTYLTGHDPYTGAGIFMIVYEPWKYTALAGIILMLVGALLLFIQGPRKR